MVMVKDEFLEELHSNADRFHPGVKSSLHVGYHWGDKYDDKESSKTGSFAL